MSPRNYRMGARATSVAETRHRIVDAAMRLHVERGVVSTSWDDIAAVAGVSTATVYRHFPSLSTLIPACAQTVFAIIQPPTLAEARGQFHDLDTAADRIEVLVRRSCHCYVLGEGWLHAAYRERDFVPELGTALDLIETTLDTLVAAALDAPVPSRDRVTLFVLCNFPFWKSLRDRGLGRGRTEDLVVRLARTEVSVLDL
jgi:AcrR family transcriptional regulator